MRYQQGRSGLFLPASANHNGRSKTVRFGPLEVYAEEGLVLWVMNSQHAKNNGHCGQLSAADARIRFKALQKGMGDRLEKSYAKDSQEYRAFKRTSDDLEEVFRTAEEQDARIKDRTRRATSVSMRGMR